MFSFFVGLDCVLEKWAWNVVETSGQNSKLGLNTCTKKLTLEQGLNKYTVEQLGIPPTKSLNVNIPQTVTLDSDVPASPPPSPGYLDVHLRIARILEASGAGRKIEQTLAGLGPYGVDPCGGTDLGEIMARSWESMCA